MFRNTLRSAASNEFPFHHKINRRSCYGASILLPIIYREYILLPTTNFRLFFFTAFARPTKKGLQDPHGSRLFYFYIFQKKFTEIYFGFQNLQFYTPTARQEGGRGPTARLRGGQPLLAACRAVGTYM